MTVTSIPSPPLTLTLGQSTSLQWVLRTPGSSQTSTGTASCGVRKKNYRDESMTLEGLGISGGNRTTQYNTTSRQPAPVHAYTHTSRDRHMPLASATTSTPLSLRGSPLRMSSMDVQLTLPTVSLCPGYTM